MLDWMNEKPVRWMVLIALVMIVGAILVARASAEPATLDLTESVQVDGRTAGGQFVP